MKNSFILMQRCLKIMMIFMLFSAVLLSGCSSTIKTKKFSPMGKIYDNLMSDDMATSKILTLTKKEEVKTLWSYLKINVSSSKFKGKKFFYCTLLSQKPDKIRLRGNRIITSTLFEILVDGEQFDIYFNRDNILYRGSIDDIKNASDKLAIYKINPHEITRGILVRQALAENLSKGKAVYLKPLKNHYRILTKREDGGYEVYAVRKFDMLPEEIGVYDKNKNLFLKITFRQFSSYKNDVLPSKYYIEFFDTDLRLDIEAQDYKLNPSLQLEVFAFQPTSETRIIPLKELIAKQESNILD